MSRWCLSLLGLALTVFGIVGLSGPGRIDIEDGQARYEAGRNLVDHGDTVLRDDRLYWNTFPGRGGQHYTGYRLPQIVVAAGCVAIADLTGPVTEGRRHFAFSLHGAFAAACLSVLYACWFRSRGASPPSALLWAALGIFTTPAWFYATSTFDEMLTAVIAVALVLTTRKCQPCVWSLLLAVPLMAVLYDCKPPMVALALVGLGLAVNKSSFEKRVVVIAGGLFCGLVLGWGMSKAYQEYKFPRGERSEFERIIREEHMPMFFGNVPEALIDIAVGPSSGVFWYFPPLVLVIAGLRRQSRPVQRAGAIAAFAIIGFVSLMTFYKGGVCWGPRYLMPLFAVGWLFAPDGAQQLGIRLSRFLLAGGIAVQLLSLQAIPERLYLERELPSGFYLEKPWLYLHPALGHIVNRPREVIEVWTATPAPLLTPSPSPTFTLPIFDPPLFNEPKGKAAVAKYQMVNGPRFWWAWMPNLEASQRSVSIFNTALMLLFISVSGGAMILGCGLYRADQSFRDQHPDQKAAEQ